MAFPLHGAARLAERGELTVAAAGPEWAVKAAWLWGLAQLGQLAGGSFAAQRGQPVSPRPEFLLQLAVPWAQLAREAQALFAEAEPQGEALELAEENGRVAEKPALALAEVRQGEQVVEPACPR